MAIDYSKWDRMDYDDDDSDNSDDDGDIVAGTPQVTSLDRPGRVTIGPGGSSIQYLGEDDGDVASSINNNDTFQSTSSMSKKPMVGIGGGIHGSTTSSGDGDVPDNQTQNQHEAGHHRKPTVLTRNGGMHHHTIFIPDDDDINSSDTNSNNDESSTRKGNEIIILIYWSQDRYAVTVRIGINPTIFSPRNIRVQCKGALPYADRHSAVGSGCDDGSHGCVEIVCIGDGRSGGGNVRGGKDMDGSKGKAAASSIVLLSEKLHRPIHLDEGEDELGFEIEDCNSDDIDDNNFQYECDGDEHGDGDKMKPTAITKFVTIHLPKAVPMIGMTYWWDRLFVGYPTIDMHTIVRSDRKEKVGENDDLNSKKGGDGTKRGEDFRKAWEGAHAAFRERMKTRERQSIDVDE